MLLFIDETTRNVTAVRELTSIVVGKSCQANFSTNWSEVFNLKFDHTRNKERHFMFGCLLSWYWCNVYVGALSAHHIVI